MKKILSVIVFMIFSVLLLGVETDQNTLFVVTNDSRWFKTGYGTGGDKFGFIDKTGKMVVPMKYDFAWGFVDGLARVRKNGIDGCFIDNRGNEIISCDYDIEDREFHDGLIRILTNRWGFLRRDGKVIVAPKFYDASEFSEGLARVEIGGKMGYIDTEGKYAIKPKFLNKALDFKEGLAAVKEKEKWGFIDKAGNCVIKPKYENAYSFHDGLASVEFGGKWGSIDKTEQIKIPFNYAEAMVLDNVNSTVEKEYPEGLYPIKVDEKTGYKNRNGEIVIKPMFTEAYVFHEGIAFVSIGGKYGYIDIKGDYVVKPEFDEIKENRSDELDGILATDGIVMAWKDDTYGYINRTGQFVWKNK
jgi:hypothetical protein